jgi:hypothetical protein
MQSESDRRHVAGMTGLKMGALQIDCMAMDGMLSGLLKARLIAQTAWEELIRIFGSW